MFLHAVVLSSVSGSWPLVTSPAALLWLSHGLSDAAVGICRASRIFKSLRVTAGSLVAKLAVAALGVMDVLHS